MVALSASLSRHSLVNLPYAGSACHGGIVPPFTFCAIARAHGRASLKVSSDIGAISPGRWHVVQFANRIGATSLLYVGLVDVVCAWAAGANARTVPRAAAAATNPVVITSTPADCGIEVSRHRRAISYYLRNKGRVRPVPGCDRCNRTTGDIELARKSTAKCE